MPWKKVSSRNIVGFIRVRPALRNEWIVAHASYDGASVVPALAPSAEATCGIAGLLELARLYKNPTFAPKRSIMFIATGAHFQGLAGMRAFMERHFDSYQTLGPVDSVLDFFNRQWPRSGAGAGTAWLVPLVFAALMLMIVGWVWRNHLVGRDRTALVMAIPIILLILTVCCAAGVYRQFMRGFDYKVANPPRFMIWAGLDLSSHTQGVGLFYKGYFYDMREDVQPMFAGLGSRATEDSERVAATLGFFDKSASRFADGINGMSGEQWRNFVSGKIALDSEVVSLAGGQGVSFLSINDDRQFVDTPLDTLDRINFDNIRKQLTMVACIMDHWFRDTSRSTARSRLERR